VHIPHGNEQILSRNSAVQCNIYGGCAKTAEPIAWGGERKFTSQRAMDVWLSEKQVETFLKMFSNAAVKLLLQPQRQSVRIRVEHRSTSPTRC